MDGALVGESLQDSPAEAAGIQSGDIILKYAGKSVDGPSELKNMVARSRPGEKVPVVLLRNKKQLRIIVTVGERPNEQERPQASTASAAKSNVFSGLSAITLTDDLARQLDLDSGERGVVVIGVLQGSPSEEAGLKRGDVIQEIDRITVNNIDDFNRIVDGIRADDTVLMFVNRGGRKFYLTVQAGG